MLVCICCISSHSFVGVSFALHPLYLFLFTENIFSNPNLQYHMSVHYCCNLILDPVLVLANERLKCIFAYLGWMHGIVSYQRNCFTPGWVSTAMGDCLRAGKPSQCVTSCLGQLSLTPGRADKSSTGLSG